jgi:hypothetical protein
MAFSFPSYLPCLLFGLLNETIVHSRVEDRLSVGEAENQLLYLT